MRHLYSTATRLAITTFHVLRCSSSLLARHVNKALQHFSAACKCCPSRSETTDYFLFDCHRYADARAVLYKSLRDAGIARSTESLLLGDNTAAVRDVAKALHVFRALSTFVAETSRFKPQ